MTADSVAEQTAQHTPGSWVLDARGEYVVVWEPATETGVLQDHVIAKVLTRLDGPKNARLIAAAPDMLAALEGVLRWAKANESYISITAPPEMWGALPKFAPAMRDALNAVGKARGDA